MLGYTIHLAIYDAIKETHEENANYSIKNLCKLGKVSRSGYYKWLNHQESENEKLNHHISKKLEVLHEEHPDMGYRRLNDKLRHDDKIVVNDKRILRICRRQQIKSNLKYRYDGCTRPSRNPYFIAGNVLNRDFRAEHLNEKWVTDVTEFKYGISFDHIHKLYLSAILDLCDRRAVAFVLSDHNNNQLVFDTFDAAVAANPDAHPILHSDRGFQYTSRAFHQKLEKAGMIQSMSRVAHCTDNGPMEGFWGILKREKYYGKKFHTRDELVQAITEYMDYYTNKRPQRCLGVLTPMEFHKKQLLVA
ncbi:IS3 family transposase [Clostridium neonatale]|uniref:IS3 family transposase n=1 Tax=Clostridium neonatale TaxID=137838 RepID=UPI002936FDF5|nr:IS3 family transposase [Clostridium neonatale]